MHKHHLIRILHLLPTLSLFMTVGYSSASAQTVANGISSLGIVKTTPRPTFYFNIAPTLRNFSSVVLTWGSNDKKDGISIKRSIYGSNSYIVTDITKTGSVVTGDASQDIYSPSYSNLTGQLSFVRSWNTPDTASDVPLVQGAPNSFQWEAIVGNTTYRGVFSSNLSQVIAP